MSEFPENPCAYLALSEAYFQEYKNAWKRNDPRAAKRRHALAQAITSMERALTLDPTNAEVRGLLADRKKRLTGLPRS